MIFSVNVVEKVSTKPALPRLIDVGLQSTKAAVEKDIREPRNVTLNVSQALAAH
jgi:hypothetical protein